MQKLTIALDMDGVMADMLAHHLNLLNINHGENLTHDDITDWDISKACKFAKPRDVYRYFEEDHFFRNLPLMPGVQEAVRALLSQGHEVIIVTAAKHGHRDKLLWLQELFPEIHQDDVYFATRKHRIPADVFVDDRFENLRDYKEANPDSLVICMDAAYNRKWNGLRAHNWDEVLYWIQSSEQVRDAMKRNRRRGAR